MRRYLHLLISKRDLKSVTQSARNHKNFNLKADNLPVNFQLLFNQKPFVVKDATLTPTIFLPDSLPPSLPQRGVGGNINNLHKGFLANPKEKWKKKKMSRF